MDHKVSKDMISSGMIPSGEKTQADLSRTQYGSAPSPSKLMDAYKSMYDKKDEVINEHHKKDADGNTIPHDEDIKESGDLYDILRQKFLEEGYDEKTVNYIMVELADDIKTLSEEPITLTIGALLAKGAAIAAKGAAVGAKVAGAAAKGGMAAAKGIGTATKGIVSAAKPVASAATKGLTQVGTKVGQTAGKVGTKVSQTASKVGQKVADTTSNVSQQVKNVATQTKDKVGQKIQDIAKDPEALKDKVKSYVKDKTKEKVKDEITKDRPLQKMNKTGVAHAGQTDIAASTDLFDIVKGRLLDEGLSEEEIKDIMLTLTPDEIMEELSDTVKRNDALNKERAMKAAQERKEKSTPPKEVTDAAKRQYKAGTAAEDPKNPYTTADKKKIINQYKNN